MQQSFRRSFLRITLFLLASAGCCSISAQQSRFRFEHLSIREGLSQSAVTAITQDSRGFLWICTADGLNRFDGYDFVHYKSNPHDNNSLSDNFCHVALEDRDKNLWVGTSTQGLNCFDSSRSRNKRFIRSSDSGDIYSISDNTIYSLLEGKDGKLWIGTVNGGVNIYDKATQRFINGNNNRNLEVLREANVNALEMSTDGSVYAATSEGLFIIHPHTYACTLINEVAATETVHSLLLTEDNKYLFLGLERTRVLRINLRNKQQDEYFLGDYFKNWTRDDFISAIYPSSNGYYWVGTGTNGLIRAEFDEMIFVQSKNDQARNYSIASNEVLSIFRDKSGIVWVGTDLGLNKLDRQNERFRLFQYETQAGPSATFNNVYAFCEDSKGRLWVGSRQGGLCLFNRKTETLSRVSAELENLSAIVEDKQGNLWVGLNQQNGGLYKLSNPGQPNTRKVFFRPDPNDSNALSSDYVSAIMLDNRGYLWISTLDQGVCILNPLTNRFTRLQQSGRGANALSFNCVYSCFQDSEGIIWISTFGGGLNKYDIQTGSFVNYSKNKDDISTLSHNNVTSVFEDSKKRLWVCTFGGGLNLLDRRTGHFTRFTEKDGLPNDAVYGILEDSRGNLWISTNNGITKFDPARRTFKNYDVKDYLQNSEFNAGAFLKTKDGTFLFGGISGFNAFKPSEVIDNPYIAPVIISAFKKFDRTVTEFIPDDYTIQLSYRENFFSFEFALLNFTKTLKNTYAYKLVGFDEDWINCGTRRYASYTNLPPGEYTFQVIAANNDGIWNKKGASVKIIITPLYWQTIWFKVLVILGILLVLAVTIYYTLNDIRKKSELKFKNELTELQLKALRAQMNPHFIFNSLNSIQQFIASSERKQALIYLSKFAKLIRQILENSSKNYVSVVDEIRTLELYVEMEKLRFESKFDYEFQIDPKIDQQSTEVPSLLIQPYIENAILHGLVAKESGGKLLIQLKKSGNGLLCIVEDNGIGRQEALVIKARKETGYKSMGMSVTKERLEILNQHMHDRTSVNIIDLYDNDGNAAGTRVEINIPIENQ